MVQRAGRQLEQFLAHREPVVVDHDDFVGGQEGQDDHGPGVNDDVLFHVAPAGDVRFAMLDGELATSQQCFGLHRSSFQPCKARRGGTHSRQRGSADKQKLARAARSPSPLHGAARLSCGTFPQSTTRGVQPHRIRDGLAR